jgi:putative PEP-CTERM system TPR-repeat lipoprotein
MNMGRRLLTAGAWMAAAAILAGCGDKPETFVVAAKAALEKNDRSAAIIQLKNALQANPDLGEARYLLGKSLLETGDVAAAEKELRKARELKVPDDQVVPLLAHAQIARGEFKKIIDEFGKVELAKPEAKADLATTVALAQLATGNADAAHAGFSAAQEAVPEYAPALLGEAKLKALAGDLQGSMALVDSVLAKSPDLFEGWMLKGDIAGSRLQLDDAIAAYSKVLELRPNMLSAHLKIATMQIQQGNTKDATVHVDAMKKIAPKHPDTLYLQALLAFREKNYVAAREAIQLQLSAAPDNLPGLTLDGSIEYQLGSYAQAEASLQKALRKSPKQRAARLMLVSTYLRQHQPSKALDALKPLLDDEGNTNADVLALAGEAYMQGGNTKEAERAFAKAAALKPDDVSKRTALALTHLSSGEGDRGFRELEEAAAADPGIRADLALIAENTRAKKYDSALKAIAALEKKQPGKALPHNLRGAVYGAKGDIAAARQSFERALAIDPTDFGAAASLARLDLADKKPDDARKRFETVLAKDPKSVRSLLALAELRARTGGTTDEIAALIGKAVSADPTAVMPRLVLINHYLRSKEPKSAVAAAQDALAAMPDRPELLEAAGEAQMAAGDTNQAIAAFTKLSQLRPDAPEPYVRIAAAQMAAKDPDGAVQSLKKALALRPDLVTAQRAMIKASLDAGRDADALAMAREVQKQRPKESMGYLLEGDVHVSKGAWPAAIAAYRNGLKNAGTADLAVRLDASLRASGSVPEAEKGMAAWLRDHPKDREIRAYLAETALGKKDFPGAAAQYRAMLEIQADDPMVLNNLAYVMGQLKDPKALEYAEKANKLAPNNPSILDTLGTLLVERGDVKRGVDVMQQASTLAPGSAGIRLNYARALIKSGQKAAAKKELESLAQLGDRFSDQAEVGRLMQQL